MKKKSDLKVYRQSGYQYKNIPAIILKGKWLEQAGFEIDDKIELYIKEGTIEIRKK